MSTFNSSLNSLLVFSESLNDLTSLKKHAQRYKKHVGATDVWPVYYSEVLIVLPYLPPNSLPADAVLAQADFYERQARELSKFLYSEFGLTYEKIHMESGSLEKLVTQYVYQYQIDKVILDLDFFEENYFLPVKRKEQKEYFEQDMDSLISLYGVWDTRVVLFTNRTEFCLKRMSCFLETDKAHRERVQAEALQHLDRTIDGSRLSVE